MLSKSWLRRFVSFKGAELPCFSWLNEIFLVPLIFGA